MIDVKAHLEALRWAMWLSNQYDAAVANQKRFFEQTKQLRYSATIEIYYAKPVDVRTIEQRFGEG